MAQHQRVKIQRFNGARDRRSACDMIPENDQGPVAVKDFSGTQSADQDSECWGDLWLYIKSTAAQLFRRKKNHLR